MCCVTLILFSFLYYINQNENNGFISLNEHVDNKYILKSFIEGSNKLAHTSENLHKIEIEQKSERISKNDLAPKDAHIFLGKYLIILISLKIFCMIIQETQKMIKQKYFLGY